VTSIVVLDTSVLGLLCSSPVLPAVADCRTWLSRLDEAGVEVVIPEITVYELRRELIRIRANSKLDRLQELLGDPGPVEVTPEAWLKAAEFWAFVRSAGKPTADRHSLDGDAILGGVAATNGRSGDQVAIATTNIGHLSMFPGVEARRWESIP
jgi:predicted nucleic acid-binding protein